MSDALAAYAKRTADEAPPLTAAQRSRIAVNGRSADRTPERARVTCPTCARQVALVSDSRLRAHAPGPDWTLGRCSASGHKADDPLLLVFTHDAPYPDGWEPLDRWRLVDWDGNVREFSVFNEARAAMRPGDMVQRLGRLTSESWLDEREPT